MTAMTKKFTEIRQDIYLITAETSVELAKLFLRFQEYYESPEFRGKIFTLEEFKDWYKTSRKANRFTYYTDWVGFNIPGHVIEYVAHNFKGLTKDEMWLMDNIHSKQRPFAPYYVIGVANGQSDVLQHEIAHAMYYINKEYSFEVDQLLWKKAHLLEDLGKYIMNLGYNESSVQDEKHAYLLSDMDRLKKDGIYIPEFDDIQRQFNEIFQRYIT